MDDEKGLALALEEASIGYQEGGIPVSRNHLNYIGTPCFTYLVIYFYLVCRRLCDS